MRIMTTYHTADGELRTTVHIGHYMKVPAGVASRNSNLAGVQLTKHSAHGLAFLNYPEYFFCLHKNTRESSGGLG